MFILTTKLQRKSVFFRRKNRSVVSSSGGNGIIIEKFTFGKVAKRNANEECFNRVIGNKRDVQRSLLCRRQDGTQG